jgi:hypothetical protein
MDCDRHPMPVGGAEDPLQPLDVQRVVVVSERIPEVQFQTMSKVRVVGTPVQLVQRIVLQRIDTAEPDQPLIMCFLTTMRTTFATRATRLSGRTARRDCRSRTQFVRLNS